MTLRDAVEADLAPIVAIQNAGIASRISTAQLTPYELEERRDWFHAHSSTTYPLIVAELDDTLAGWLGFREFLPRCAYAGTVEISVYVATRFHRRGIGRALLREAIARAPQLQFHSLVGLIFAENGASIALFRDAGFERWGLLPGIARIDGRPCDLTIYGRKL